MEIKVSNIGYRKDALALHQLTITDNSGFTYHEVFTNAEADELMRKLIVSRHGNDWGNHDYTGVFCNGFIHDIKGTPAEEEKRACEEAAMDAFLAKIPARTQA